MNRQTLPEGTVVCLESLFAGARLELNYTDIDFWELPEYLKNELERKSGTQWYYDLFLVFETDDDVIGYIMDILAVDRKWVSRDKLTAGAKQLIINYTSDGLDPRDIATAIHQPVERVLEAQRELGLSGAS